MLSSRHKCLIHVMLFAQVSLSFGCYSLLPERMASSSASVGDTPGDAKGDDYKYSSSRFEKLTIEDQPNERMREMDTNGMLDASSNTQLHT